MKKTPNFPRLLIVLISLTSILAVKCPPGPDAELPELYVNDAQQLCYENEETVCLSLAPNGVYFSNSEQQIYAPDQSIDLAASAYARKTLLARLILRRDARNWYQVDSETEEKTPYSRQLPALFQIKGDYFYGIRLFDDRLAVDDLLEHSGVENVTLLPAKASPFSDVGLPPLKCYINKHGVLTCILESNVISGDELARIFRKDAWSSLEVLREPVLQPEEVIQQEPLENDFETLLEEFGPIDSWPRIYGSNTVTQVISSSGLVIVWQDGGAVILQPKRAPLHFQYRGHTLEIFAPETHQDEVLIEHMPGSSAQ